LHSKFLGKTVWNGWQIGGKREEKNAFYCGGIPAQFGPRKYMEKGRKSETCAGRKSQTLYKAMFGFIPLATVRMDETEQGLISDFSIVRFTI
jgi:hypothetical protein